MSSHEKTMKLVTNLDRAAIEQRLVAVRNAAQSGDLPELAALFTGIEGLPRAQMEAKVKSAIKWLLNKPEHKNLMAQIELVELNLPNLKQ
jgi:hypothetical protein